MPSYQDNPHCPADESRLFPDVDVPSSARGVGTAAAELAARFRAYLPDQLLPDADVNVGRSNSARGAGTTVEELAARFRLYHCGACLLVLLFRTLPLAFHPIRLTRLLASPVRLLLEAIAGALALCLLLVAAQAPVLGARARGLSRRLTPFLDLDAAQGRAASLAIVGAALALSNYLSLSRGGPASGVSGGGGTGAGDIANATNSTEATGEVAVSVMKGEGMTASPLVMFVQCTLLSLPAAAALLVAGYTAYALRAFPEYATWREDAAEETPGTDSDREYSSFASPSWANPLTYAGNFGRGVSDFGRGVSDFGRGGGYQSVDT